MMSGTVRIISLKQWLIQNVGLISIIILAGLLYLLRLLNAPQLGVLHDDASYLNLAESLATGNGYSRIYLPGEPPETVWPPGYPLLILAPLWLIVGPSYAILRSASLVLSVINILLVYKIFFGAIRKPFLLLLIALFAFNNWVAQSAINAMSESAFIFFSLAFFYFFSKWESTAPRINISFALAAFCISTAFWVRYWGLALLVSVGIYLILTHRFRWALLLGIVFFLFSLPMLALVFQDSGNTVSATYAGGALETRVLDLNSMLARLPVTLTNYWKAAPYVVAPLMGQKVLAILEQYRLLMIRDLFHLAILLVMGAGFWFSHKKSLLPALYVVFYFAFVLLLTGNLFIEGRATVFDEPRYTSVMLPFLYFLLIQGMTGVGKLVFKSQEKADRLVFIAGISLAAFSLVYSVYLARIEFAVPDISSGSDWIKANVPEDTVLMVTEPERRYLYLRRKAVSYPEEISVQALHKSIKEFNIRYIILAPPVDIDWIVNYENKLDPYAVEFLLPELYNHPEDYQLVFTDFQKNTLIFEVLNPGN